MDSPDLAINYQKLEKEIRSFWRVHGSPMGGTTGVSLEQGLGLTDISRGRPGRRPGGERSSPPDYYFIIDKINPGPHRGRLVGPLVPSS